MNGKKIVLIHGNGNSSPHDHWFPWAKTAFEKLGFVVIARQFPEPELAPQRLWLSFLKHDIKADKDTILIGHSSGAVAAMRYAENNKLLGSVLVAACYTDLGIESERASGYYNRPFNWDAIRNNQQWIIQYASLDDPWIPIEQARTIHHHLNTDYYEYTNRGHMGCGSGMTTFPELITAVECMIKKGQT